MIAPFEEAYPDVLPWPVTAVLDYVDDRSPRTLQVRQSIVRHAVVVHQVTVERSDIFVDAGGFQTDLVVAPRVAHERINMPKRLESLIYGLRTVFRCHEIYGDESAGRTASL